MSLVWIDRAHSGQGSCAQECNPGQVPRHKHSDPAVQAPRLAWPSTLQVRLTRCCRGRLGRQGSPSQRTSADMQQRATSRIGCDGWRRDSLLSHILPSYGTHSCPHCCAPPKPRSQVERRKVQSTLPPPLLPPTMRPKMTLAESEVCVTEAG